MTGEELDTFFREQDRLWDEIDAEIARLAAAPRPDLAPVDIFRCPACGAAGSTGWTGTGSRRSAGAAAGRAGRSRPPLA